MVQLRTIAAPLAGLVSTVAAYGYPGACSGVCVNTHDPSIIQSSNGTYYRFSTGGKIAVHTAPALTGPWVYQGAAIPAGSIIDLDGSDDLWAPEVVNVDGTYYLFYSVSTFGVQDSAIGVATSSSLDVGTWSDKGSTGVASSDSKNYNAIDPNLIEVSGTWYMNFGSWWGGIYQVAMKDPPRKTAGSASYNLAYEATTTAIEGAFMYKYGSYYYLFFSQGYCCGYDASKPAAGAEYQIKVCRSTSATGSFKDKSGTACTASGGTTVLESHDWVYGPGGQGVYTDPTYGPVLYYHYVDTRIGYADGQKQFGWQQISFSTGWPVV